MSNASVRINSLQIAPIPGRGASPTSVVEERVEGGVPMPSQVDSLDDLLDLDEFEEDMALGQYSCHALPPIIDF